MLTLANWTHIPKILSLRCRQRLRRRFLKFLDKAQPCVQLVQTRLGLHQPIQTLMATDTHLLLWYRQIDAACQRHMAKSREFQRALNSSLRDSLLIACLRKCTFWLRSSCSSLTDEISILNTLSAHRTHHQASTLAENMADLASDTSAGLFHYVVAIFNSQLQCLR